METTLKMLESMVNSFTDADELMNFAATYGIQDSPSVRFRLFQLHNREYRDDYVNEQLNTLLDNLGGPLICSQEYKEDRVLKDYLKLREEIEESVRILLLDEEMEETGLLCINDGEWNPLSPVVQIGSGDEPQQGPSDKVDDKKLKYTIRQKSKKTFAKKAAVDTTYQVKIDEEYRGQQLGDLREGLRDMFQDVIDQTRGDLAGNDLGRVVLHHGGLHDPIVVPLQTWDNLNAQTVMEIIEKVLNSNQGLSIDDSFYIMIGTIELPKGSSSRRRRRITRLHGHKNSLEIKRSIITIENADQLCMARAIGVCWAKLKRCSPEEWKDVSKNRQGKSNVELILEHRKVSESFYKDLCKKNLKQQGQLAAALCEMAGIPSDRPAILNDIEAFEDLLGVRVMVVSARLGNKFITSPKSDERPCIYLYLVDDEHFHAILSITGFFSAGYFCEKCLKHYTNKLKHRCEEKCIVCKRSHCPKSEDPKTCEDCNMECRSPACYDHHRKVPLHMKGKKKGHPSGPSQCQKWWKCSTCYKVLRADKRKKEDHICGEHWCSSCEKYVMSDHKCYLRAKECKEDFIPKYIFFDFECSQDEVTTCQEGYKSIRKRNCTECQLSHICKSCSKCQNCHSSWCGKATHRPNFVVAHTVCPECIDKELTPDSTCKGCGTRCELCEKSPDLYDNEDTGPCSETCGFREVVFQGEKTAEQFGQWLFSEQHEYFKVVAHNMKGYDGIFLLEYLVDNSMRPDKIFYSGSKIMYMSVERDLHIKVIDSLNFLPMKLSALPKAFGLKELKKGWFPHFFNTKENQNYVGPYPASYYYGHDFLNEKERKELINWLSEQKKEVFDFRKEMLGYCRSDVTILRQACLKFRELLMNATGEQKEVVNKKGKREKKWVRAVDPFDSVTIASVCMNVFRTKFLDENWRVQVDGNDTWVPAKMKDGVLYVSINGTLVNNVNVTKKEFVSTPIAKIPPCGYKDQYSKASIQWLQWRAFVDKSHIVHALNGGEKTIPGTRYKLDGYCSQTHTAFEFHGCLHHSCIKCFPDNRENTFHPITKQSMNELYALTMKKKAYLEKLGMKYVCIWECEFKDEMKRNSELRTFVDQLDLTDRLDPRESFFGGRTNASRLYYKTEGREKIKYVDFTSLYPWVNKYCRYPVGHPTVLTKDFGGIQDYFGIAKVKILPPRGLYHPVLPERSNGKLKFPLCRTCADAENQDPCYCSDKERVLTGTWCTPEIQTALRLGYKIQKIYEVYNWEESTEYDPQTGEGGLFTQYINTFLKFKQEASGPPDWTKSTEDMNNYAHEYLQKEGVCLDLENITKNPGLRALAKLCLNSFWGKFGQRLNMRQTDIFHESQANQFFQTFTDPTKQPVNFHILNNEMIQLEWIYKRDCQPEDNKTNIYLATFTTCWARLKLYSVLEELNERVLYYDTDSVIYVSRPEEVDIPLGDYLGELTNELDMNEHIIEFVSGGPKNYAYKTNMNRETCKVRGFTLNYTNSQLINFESVKSIVTDSESDQIIAITNPTKICRDKRKRKLYTMEETKTYQMVYTKRRRVENYDTLPYGF